MLTVELVRSFSLNASSLYAAEPSFNNTDDWVPGILEISRISLDQNPTPITKAPLTSSESAHQTLYEAGFVAMDFDWFPLSQKIKHHHPRDGAVSISDCRP